MTDDTPRDPLAALLHDESVRLDNVASSTTHHWCSNGHMGHFAALAARLRERGVTLDATRPSGDEALRAAAQALLDLDQSDDWSLDAEGDAKAALRTALATPSSAPDVEGHDWTIPHDHRCPACEALFRDSRS
jgi:hypothetical protein